MTCPIHTVHGEGIVEPQPHFFGWIVRLDELDKWIASNYQFTKSRKISIVIFVFTFK